jgi:hypothetical protein
MTVQEFDPNAARQLPPGIALRISRRTFAQVAAQRCEEIQGGLCVTSGTLRELTMEQGRALFAAAAAAAKRLEAFCSDLDEDLR